MALLEGPKEKTVLSSKNYLTILLAVLASLTLSGCPSPDSSFAGSLNPPDPSAGGGPGSNPLDGELQMEVSEGGSVTSDPDILGTCVGVFPTGFCFASAPIGTVVTLMATPAIGFDFSRWENCPGESGNLCVFTMNTAVIIRANFVAQ